ncbi:hypothetical protein EYR38_010716 [Pleurotus pulmonarius]|nr:hypothetical protein EYR38_010716 [Pleurotus pulmonarius]
MVLTIRAWYNHHNTTQLREVYLQGATGIAKNPKGGSFHLELFVYLDRYMARTQEGATGSTFGNEIANTSSLKRRAHEISSGKAKRSRGPSGTILTSRFAPTNSLTNLPIPHITTTITFRYTKCSVDDNGNSFLAENDTTETGSLDKAEIQLPPGARGRTKTIYGLTIAGRQFIAKKLVNIGDGLTTGRVEPDVASKYLTTDLIRLTQMRYFANLFIKHADERGVELAPFHVSEGFLIKSYSKGEPLFIPEGEPEMAPEKFDAVYLVEPRRTSFAVIKFSGTLGTLNNIDQKTATMSAFSHYVLEQSACVFMFSDIQGTMEPSATGLKLVLFDPMTHTRTGKSGLGDHGLTGIKDFIDHHECSPICRQLMLCSVEDLETTFKTLDDADSDSEGSDSE